MQPKILGIVPRPFLWPSFWHPVASGARTFFQSFILSVTRTLEAEQDQLLLWPPVFLGFGLLTYFALSAEPGLLEAALVGFLAVGAGVWAFWPGGSMVRKFCGGMVCCFLVGLVAGFVRTHTLATPMLTKPFGPAALYGRIESLRIIRTAVTPKKGDAVARPFCAKLVLRLMRPLHNKNHIRGVPRHVHKVRLHVTQGFQGLKVGDSIQIFAKLNTFPSPPLPTAYDSRRAAYFEGVAARGVAFGAPKPWAPKQKNEKSWIQNTIHKVTNGFQGGISHIRGILEGAFHRSLSPAAAAFASALLLGDTSNISSGVRQDFAASGIAHLLAVSGLHMSIMAGLAFFLIGRFLGLSVALSARINLYRWASVATIGFSFFYLHLSGARIPATRAFWMTSLAMLALSVGRSPFTLRLVAFAATLSLLSAPENILSPSFQLSFAAVTALVGGIDFMRPIIRLRYWSSLGRFGHLPLVVGGLLSSSFVAGLATAPFTAATFHQITLLGALTNLLAIPWTTFVLMPLGLGFLILYPVGLAGWVAPIFNAGLSGLIHLARIMAQMPLASISVPDPASWALSAICLGGLWLLLWQTRIRIWGAAPLCTGFVGLFLGTAPDFVMDGEGKAFGFFDHQTRTLWTSSRNKGLFVQESWAQALGARNVFVFPFDTDGPLSGVPKPVFKGEYSPDNPHDLLACMRSQVFCDEHSCLVLCIRNPKKRALAVVLNHQKWEPRYEKAARLLLSLEPLEANPNATILDRMAAWRQGSFAVYVDKNNDFRVTSALQKTGRRPWTRFPKPFPKRKRRMPRRLPDYVPVPKGPLP